MLEMVCLNFSRLLNKSFIEVAMPAYYKSLQELSSDLDTQNIKVVISVAILILYRIYIIL